MEKLSFYSRSSEETINFAKKIAIFLKKGDVLGFFGNLGSGKTTFIKGLAKGMGLKNKVSSPSFVILRIYSFKKNVPLYHFDLYRIRFLKEIEDIGYEDFITDASISVIEWADKAGKLLPEHHLKIRIQIKAENARLIDLISNGGRYDSLIRRIKLYGKEHKL